MYILVYLPVYKQSDRKQISVNTHGTYKRRISLQLTTFSGSYLSIRLVPNWQQLILFYTDVLR